MSLNCRSLRKKTHILKDLIDVNNIDVVALQETWLQGDLSIYEEFKEKGFKIRKLERTGKRGGGLAIMTKSNTINKISPNRTYNLTGFDNITCRITIGKVSFTLVNLYRPPANSKSEFLSEFETFLSNVLEDEGMVIIVGDFNINWLCKDHVIDEFTKILNANGLTQIINLPTRESALLDFLITQDCYKDVVNILNPINKDFKSDHKPIFSKIIMDFSASASDFTEQKSRDYNLLDFKEMKCYLEKNILLNPDETKNLSSSEITALYNQTISTYVNEKCPVKTKVFKRSI